MKRRHTVLLTAMALGLASPAGAAPITFAFEGYIDHVSSELGDRFEVGDPFSGHYTFESTTPGSGGSSPPESSYYDMLSEFSITIGDYAAMMNPMAPNSIELYDSGRKYTVDADSVIGEAVDGWWPSSFWFSLYHSHPAGTGLPLVPPDITTSVVSDFVLSFYKSGTQETSHWEGHVTSLTLVENEPVAVSEPPALATLGAGFLGLGWIIRRRKRACPDRMAECH